MSRFGVFVFMFGLAQALSAAANADPMDYSSQSQINPLNDSTISDNGTTSSSVSIDATNYAKSFITPGTSTMGAAVSADPSVSYSPQTLTTHDDSWWFNCDAKHICESVPLNGSIPVQLTLGVKVSETQVQDFSYVYFDANYSLQNSGQFDFSFVQDGQGDFELHSAYTDALGNETDVPVTYQDASGNQVPVPSDARNNPDELPELAPGGIYTLTVDTTLNTSVCNFDSCIPEAMSCTSGSCTSTPAFSDVEKIDAGIDSDTNLAMVDGYDPFSLNIVSLDPNYQFISADGRTISNLSTGPTNDVPEPATWAMFLTGLGVFGAAGYRRAKATGRLSAAQLCRRDPN